MDRPTRSRCLAPAAALLLTLLAVAPVTAAPEGQLTWAFHVSLAPAWFDPAETTGIITPFKFLCAMHDALVKSMPGNPLAPSLAESWTVAPDGLAYEFVLRRGVTFHNGEPVTAEDVKFSMERYCGGGLGSVQGAHGEHRRDRSASHPLPLQAAVARLPDVLRHAGHRCRLGRAEEV